MMCLTPAEWCARLGYEVLDPDGWREHSPYGPLDWTELITEDDFRRRLAISTIRDTAYKPSPFPLSEAIAKAFHETYEALAPQYGYKTRDESAVPWESVPDANRRLMVATVYALLTADVIEAAQKVPSPPLTTRSASERQGQRGSEGGCYG